jgi:hypothetical protein
MQEAREEIKDKRAEYMRKKKAEEEKARKKR